MKKNILLFALILSFCTTVISDIALAVGDDPRAKEDYKLIEENYRNELGWARSTPTGQDCKSTSNPNCRQYVYAVEDYCTPLGTRLCNNTIEISRNVITGETEITEHRRCGNTFHG